MARGVRNSKANMDSLRNISLHSRLWIAALAATALSTGTWPIAPAPANADDVIGVGIPFPGLYAQYPYYPYPPGYYPYYPPAPRYMKTYGLTHEQLAMVSVVQREWAAKNPRATFKTPIRG